MYYTYILPRETAAEVFIGFLPKNDITVFSLHASIFYPYIPSVAVE
jgi:hypothetical protein